MNWIIAIPLLPAIAFLLTICLPRSARNKSVLLPVVFMVASAALALVGLVKVFPGGEIGHSLWSTSWTLATIGATPLKLSLSLDPLAMVMLAMVSVVGSCVQIFSLFYMKDDDRKGWYFTVLSLFTAAMLFLVMAADLLFIFAMWEIMGLCSYLLIGFWYVDEAPRKASQKAFLITRAADIGFIVALAAIFTQCGTFDLATVLSSASSWAPSVLLVVSIGLIWAAMGKSAQWPLMVWLPDAMAGPTPSSALIHAATMVAAGVFVLARMLPVLALSHIALTLLTTIGIITALVGGFLACFQTDIKKMLAYSTISQLGLMFVGLGANAAVPTLFHLTTHAFFKSMLFLAAGIIIHATHTQDMRKMGGLARKMPITTVVFSIGAFSLAGLVPLSGFFSKDEIFASILHTGNTTVFVLGLVMALTTALYVSKAWFTVFFGKPRTKGVHEGTALELVPVSILAALTLVLGFFSPAFARFLGHEGAWPEMGLATISSVVTLAGGLIGFFMYAGVIDTEKLSHRFKTMTRAFNEKLYFDYAYDLIIIQPYMKFCDACWAFDSRVIDGIVNGVSKAYVGLAAFSWSFDGSVIDGAVNGCATLAKKTGTAFKKLQSGRVLNYQRLMVGAVVILLFIVVILKGA